MAEELILNFTDLDDIRDALVRFPKSKWYPLGESLGLPKATLDAIRVQHNDVAERCFSELLLIWLQNVSGQVTWDTLADSLHAIEENTVAQEVYDKKGEFSDPASQILQKYSNRLSEVLVPYDMLYTEGIVSSEVSEKIEMLEGCLIDGPLRYLRNVVYKNHDMLKRFASVLLKTEDTVSLGKDIIYECERMLPSLVTPPITASAAIIDGAQKFSSGTLQGDAVEINPNPTAQIELDKIRDGLVQLLCIVAPLIEAVIPSVDDFISLLKRYRPSAKPLLSLAKSFDDVLEIIKEKCSITNISLLEIIVNHYSISEANDYILAFRANVNQFCEINITNIQFKKLSSSLLTCDTIKFVVSWEATSCTLHTIKGLLWTAFSDLDREVEVISFNELVIICYAPHHMTDILLVTAQGNLEALIEAGVIKMLIGHHTVYDKNIKEMEMKRLQDKLVVAESCIEKLSNDLFSHKGIEKKQWLSHDGSVIEDSQLKRKYLLTQRLNKAMTLQVEHMISDVQSKHGRIEELTTKMELLQEKVSKLKSRLQTPIDEKVTTVSKEDIEILQREVSILSDRLKTKDEIIQDIETKCNDAIAWKKATLAKPLSIANTIFMVLTESDSNDTIGTVTWHSDAVEVTSVSRQQCIDVLSYLMQEGDKHQRISVHSLSLGNTILLLSQLHQTGIKYVDIHNTLLNHDCVYCICNCIKPGQLLGLTLDNVSLNVTTLKLLIDSIDISKTLQSVEFVNEMIGENISHITDVFIINESLQSFTFRNCDLADNSISNLAESLIYNNTVTYLDVTSNPFGVTGLYSLLDVLTKTNNHIVKLKLDGHHISLCEGFSQYEKIKHLLVF